MLIRRPDDAALDAALDRAAALDLALALTAPDEEAEERTASGRVAAASPADLWRAAALGDTASLARALAAAKARPEVATALSRAFAAHAVAAFRPLRAAADSAATRRLDGGFTLETRRSQTRPGRAFLVIGLPPGAAAPAQLVYERAGAWGALTLGPAADGVIQMTLDTADPALAAIEDRDATLFLR